SSALFSAISSLMRLLSSLLSSRSAQPSPLSYMPGGGSLRLQLSATGPSFLSSAPPEPRSATGSTRGTALGSVCRLRARSLPRFFLRHWSGGAERNLRAHDKQHQRKHLIRMTLNVAMASRSGDRLPRGQSPP